MAAYPRFRVLNMEEGDGFVLVGWATTTHYGGETWIAHGRLGFLLSGEHVVAGRWQARGEQWAFVLKSGQAHASLRVESEWAVLDYYWGQRAAIVLDRSRHWRKARFEPSDAVEIRRANGRWWTRADVAESGSGTLIKGGWDHEHCAICWETIGACGRPEAYFSEPYTWVCEECFDQFVRPKSLAFIES